MHAILTFNMESAEVIPDEQINEFDSVKIS